MNTRLVVDKEDGLKEASDGGRIHYPKGIRLSANLLSYIFHPVFVPVYIVAFIVFIHPYIFAGFSPFDKSRTLIMALMMYSFFPLVTVGLLKALKFIETVHLHNQKDRIIPLVACGVWYFWIWYVWRNLPDYPALAVQLSLAIWISVSLALLANIIMKVSLHAISMGVMLLFFIFLGFDQTFNVGTYISVAFIITGLVCTSRFIVSDHSNQEVYGGLAVGILAMFIAHMVG